jgi:acetyl-CoA C-acetyltransferase
VVLVHPDLARNLPKPGIRILGAAEAVAHTSAGRRDYLVSAAAQTAPRAFGEAGVSHGDVDMAMIYDSFTITVLMTLEDLGFCKKGEGGRFVEDGRLELGGELPINTDGGGLSSNHPGMRGIFLIIEAVRQLRGECGPRQVKNCRLALVHGTGGALGSRHSGATLILGRG